MHARPLSRYWPNWMQIKVMDVSLDISLVALAQVENPLTTLHGQRPSKSRNRKCRTRW